MNNTEKTIVPAAEYVEVDKNMVIETSITEPDIKFYDVRKEPFEIYGFYDPYGQPFFRRLPAEVADATSANVAKLAKESVGGRVRFSTDSSYVAIKAEMPAFGRNSHTPLEASAGFDLYEDYPDFGESRYVKSFLPPYKSEGGYEQIIKLGDKRKTRCFTINFPLHSCVKNLYVGLQEDATLGEGAKYRNSRPIVIYGSSIVHGTGATRPGLIYSNMLTRRLNMDIFNLGFSGNAKGEDAMTDYIAGLSMSIFICDYDHNAPNVEHLQATHRRMYDRFREKQPDTPYVIVSRPNISSNPASAVERRDVIIDTFRHARQNGDRRIWYIDGESFFLGRNENDCTLDAVHPNDMGYSLMADGFECTIRHILEECPGLLD